jgi:signal transduction histidine kinase
MRAGMVVLVVPMGLITTDSDRLWPWLVPALGLVAVWAGIFAWVGLRRGLVAPLVAFDTALVIGLCLLSGDLVRTDLYQGTNWVAAIASFCVVSLPLAWPAWASIPSGAAIAAACYVGLARAGYPMQGVVQALVLIVQVVGTAIVMAVIRRGSAAADRALTEAAEAERVTAVARARRADESAQLRLLHDTALTTLTMVGTGAVGNIRGLRERAAADLAAIDGISISIPAQATPVRLDAVLTDVVRSGPETLQVSPTLTGCEVPATVAEAFAGSVAEALRNVGRHAGVLEATLVLAAENGRIRVELTDRGRGFDPDGAPAHRYGIRQSIVGRMAEVGGEATLWSAPGQGTRWTLMWKPEPA